MLPHATDYYLTDTWTKIFNDAQTCAPVTYASPTTTWVIYADVLHGCNAPGRIGAGTVGLTIMGRGDLEGLIGTAYLPNDCGENLPAFPIGRYIGGAGHEMGHTFGLPHPPGCDAGLSTCDRFALMWQGYSFYPNTYFRTDEKVVLTNNPFITMQEPSLALHLPKITRSNVELRWVASAPPASGYVVRASLTPGGPPIAELRTSQAGVLSVAAPDGTYYVTIDTNIDGKAVTSNEVEVVVGRLAPAAPTAPTVSVNGSTVTLSWTSRGGRVMGYRLEAGTAPGATNIGSIDVSAYAYLTVASVPPGTYYVRVRAWNTDAWSPASAEAVVIVP
jgi:hypothetical protein